MPKQITYRRVDAAQTQEVANVHRGSFPPEHVARTIFGAPGVAKYLSALIGPVGFSSEHSLVGAWDKQTMVGYAHGRKMGEAWHLNYIAVLPAYQSSGVGRSLWRAWIEQRSRDSTELTLDVEETNHAAVAWYERMGFTPIRRTWMYEKELFIQQCETAEPLQLVDWENAEAWQRVYGFSQFQIASGGSVWQVGRLGDDYFRVSAMLPDHLEQTLHEMDPSRKLLIVSSKPLQSAHLGEASVSLRMANRIKA